MRWGRAILAAMGAATLATEVYFAVTQLVPLFSQLFIAQPVNIYSVLLYAGYAGVVAAGAGIASLAILFAVATEDRTRWRYVLQQAMK